MVVTPLRQMDFDNINFNKTQRPEGFKKGINEVTTKDGKGTYLLFKDRDGYSRFSGGSVVFIFKDEYGNTIVRDFAGSLNGIKNEGQEIKKEYKLKPNELTIGYHDVGSYSAKPKANKYGILKSSHHSHGIGADDRCGVALCYSLKDTGHSILIIDGEERGMIGSRFFVEENKDLFDYINKTHSFIIQFDRMREFEFNCYKETGTPEFIKYIENKTEFKQFKGPEAYTDIVTLCKVLAGVNFSVGYNLLHTPREYVDVNDYLNTLFIIRDWLSSEEKIERFEILDTYKTSFNKHIIANDYELETSNDMFVNLLRRLNDISIIERKIKRKKYKRNRQLSKKVKDEFQSWES
jgi:hypothetical protein